MGTVTVNGWQLLALALTALWCGMNIGRLLTGSEYQRIKQKLYANAMAFKQTARYCKERGDDAGIIYWAFRWAGCEEAIKDAGLMDDFIKIEKEFAIWEEQQHVKIKDRDA